MSPHFPYLWNMTIGLWINSAGETCVAMHVFGINPWSNLFFLYVTIVTITAFTLLTNQFFYEFNNLIQTHKKNVADVPSNETQQAPELTDYLTRVYALSVH